MEINYFFISTLSINAKVKSAINKGIFNSPSL